MAPDDTRKTVLAEDGCPQPEELSGLPLDAPLGSLTVRQYLEVMRYVSMAYPVPSPQQPPIVSVSDGHPPRVVFNFDYISKKEIYAMLIQIIHRQGFHNTTAEIIRFMAEFTNLGSESSIHALLYRYMHAVL